MSCRPRRSPRVLAAAALGLALAAATASAQQTAGRPQSAPPSADADATPLFDAGGIGIEFAIGAFNEAWNLNDSREWLVDGTASVWWAFRDGAMLVAEFHAARVFQDPSRAAWVSGFTPLLRWRLLEPGAWTLFVDVGPGISWSDTAVPLRGTRFNYLLLAGSGLARRLGRQSHAIVGFRWLHVSNNGREGRGRNPDIEALGGYAGVSLSFAE